MPKRLRTYGLRTLLLLFLLFAIFLACYVSYRNCSRQAYDHYCESLSSAFRAVSVHLEDADSERMVGVPYNGYERWITAASIDRETLEEVRHLWSNSIHATELKEYYWRIHNNPLLLLSVEPTRTILPELPKDDSKLEAWWNDNIKQYINHHKLYVNVNGSMVIDENIDIFNAWTGRQDVKQFFALDNLLPYETARD